MTTSIGLTAHCAEAHAARWAQWDMSLTAGEAVLLPALTSRSLPAALVPGSPMPFCGLSNLFTHGGHTQTSIHTYIKSK